jgi:HPr kinase/phosphorylase
MRQKVNIERLIEVYHLVNIVENSNITRLVTVCDVNRPGLELTGYFDYTDYRRVIILGNKEITYINSLEDKSVLDYPFSVLSKETTPAIIITNNNECPKTLLEFCKKNQTAVLITPKKTSEFITNLTLFLNESLSPSTSLHGTLIEVSGVGILLTGESGIGKSEIALDLIKRGHRLVADDKVDILNVSNSLIGSSPDFLKKIIEVRGLGIIEVTSIFGITSFKEKQEINYCIELVPFGKEIGNIDRLGVDSKYKEILGVNIAYSTLPVAVGRNMGDIIEIAVKNYLLKINGFVSGKIFSDNIDKLLIRKGKKK